MFNYYSNINDLKLFFINSQLNALKVVVNIDNRCIISYTYMELAFWFGLLCYGHQDLLLRKILKVNSIVR